jgi:O-6-methylguanine DNA methyltransferase
MNTIYYSNIDSPINKISFCWTFKPSSKVISIDLFNSETGLYIPSADHYISNFINKVFKNNNVEYKFIEKYDDYPEFIQQLVKEIENYFYEKNSFTYPLEYFTFETLSEFSKNVLIALASVSTGKLISYKGLAEKAGSPKAFRAVGSVMNKNPYPLIIPCHRVIKEDRTIGGFAPGIEMKKILLEHENSLCKVK